MKNLICLLPLLALSSCGPMPSKDGYVFEEREWTRDKVTVVIIEHDSVNDLRKAAPSATKEEGTELMAWSTIRGKHCIVHVVSPENQYRPEWIGHEIAHCQWGRWHQTGNKTY